MRNYLSLVFVALLLAFTGCEEDKGTNNPDDNDGKSNPLTSQGLVCKVDGTELKYDLCSIVAHTPVADYLTIAAPDVTVIQLRTLPNEKGTYKNTEGANTFRKYNVWFTYEGKFYQANNDIGSSTITLTEVGEMGVSPIGYTGIIKGSFSGTFVADDNTEIVVTDGFFYAVVPA